jgi:hypothetical protein
LEKAWNGPGGDSGKEWENLEDGSYPMQLTGIKEVERKKFQSEELETRWLWTFETLDEVDSEGNTFKVFHTTGRSYGNDKANLTKFVDNLLGGKRLTMDEWMDSDYPEAFIGNEYKVLVTNNEVVRDGNTRTYTNVVKAVPLKGKNAKLRNVKTEAEDDAGTDEAAKVDPFEGIDAAAQA